MNLIVAEHLRKEYNGSPERVAALNDMSVESSRVSSSQLWVRPDREKAHCCRFSGD